VITLFPDWVKSVVTQGVVGRAATKGIFTFQTWNPRDFTNDVHHTVDDRPYGGGPGMVMKVAPLRAAIHAARAALPLAKVVYLSPQGTVLNQNLVQKTAVNVSQLILVAGRYEGIDERVLTKDIDAEWSLGDFVLSGGEIAAMAVIDALVRMLPGTLGDDLSAVEDSFSAGLLDHPHYTRPPEIDGQCVPEVLQTGDHAVISQYRLQQRLGKTWLKRPDLLKEKVLTASEQNLLEAFKKDYFSGLKE